jgi:hypothetical protein
MIFKKNFLRENYSFYLRRLKIREARQVTVDLSQLIEGFLGVGDVLLILKAFLELLWIKN